MTERALVETTLAPAIGVRTARDRYFSDNGVSADGYQLTTFQIDVFGRTWTLPNIPSRRRAIPLHDLHHVATGYGTDLVGEAETSAYELVAGIDSLFLWCFKLAAITLGLFLAPRRVVRSARRARRLRTLYRLSLPYDELLAMTLGDLRARLGMPPEGLAEHAARLHRRAPRPSGRS